MMKHKLIITGIVVATVGALLMAIGITHHASMNLIWANNRFQIVQHNQKTVRLGNVQRLIVDADDYSVTIRQGTDRRVHVTGPTNEPVNVVQNQGTVTITSSTRGLFHLEMNPIAAHITITLPAGTHLDELKAELADGDMDIDGPLTVHAVNLSLDDGNLTASKLTGQSGRVTLGDGNTELRHVNLDQVNLGNDDGNVRVSDSLITAGGYHTEDGWLSFTNTKFNDVVKVQSDDGNVSLNAPQTDGYVLTTDDGTVRLFGRRDRSRQSCNVDAPNRVEAHSSDGDVSVK